MTVGNKLLAIGMLILTAGCATSVDLPLTHFQSSETQGEKRAKIDGAYQAQSSVVLSDDFTYTAPTTTNPRIETDRDIFIGGAYGLLENLDLGVRTPAYLYGKIQLAGNSRAKAVEIEKSFSLSTYGAIGGDRTKKESGDLFSTNYYDVELNTFFFDAGVVAGYRTSKDLMFYAGPFYTYGDYDGKYRVTGSPTSNVDFAGKIRTLGGTLGLDFTFSNLGVMLEAAVARTKSGNVSNTLWGAGLMGSILF